METSDSMKNLLSAVSKNLDDDTFVLSTLQGLIAAEITGRRIELDMTQKEFARLLNVSQSTLSKWESGETNFTLSTLVSIASKLNIEMQSPFVPTPSISFPSRSNNIITFNPKGWHSSSSVVFAQETKTETSPILKEM